jgi:hypothetical protein
MMRKTGKIAFLLRIGAKLFVIFLLQLILIGLMLLAALAVGLLGKALILEAGVMLTGKRGFGLSHRAVGIIALLFFAVPAGALCYWVIYRMSEKWKQRIPRAWRTL